MLPGECRIFWLAHNDTLNQTDSTSLSFCISKERRFRFLFVYIADLRRGNAYVSW